MVRELRRTLQTLSTKTFVVNAVTRQERAAFLRSSINVVACTHHIRMLGTRVPRVHTDGLLELLLTTSRLRVKAQTEKVAVVSPFGFVSIRCVLFMRFTSHSHSDNGDSYTTTGIPAAAATDASTSAATPASASCAAASSAALASAAAASAAPSALSSSS